MLGDVTYAKYYFYDRRDFYLLLWWSSWQNSRNEAWRLFYYASFQRFIRASKICVRYEKPPDHLNYLEYCVFEILIILFSLVIDAEKLRKVYFRKFLRVTTYCSKMSQKSNPFWWWFTERNSYAIEWLQLM